MYPLENSHFVSICTGCLGEKKWGGVGSKGGALARGCIIITMETGEDRFNQFWLHPVKEQAHRILPLFLGTILSQSGWPLQTHPSKVANQLPMSRLLKSMVVFLPASWCVNENEKKIHNEQSPWLTLFHLFFQSQIFHFVDCLMQQRMSHRCWTAPPSHYFTIE